MLKSKQIGLNRQTLDVDSFKNPGGAYDEGASSFNNSEFHLGGNQARVNQRLRNSNERSKINLNHVV